MASTVLREPATTNFLDETKFIKPDFGIYKRHQHATIINVDLICGYHYVNDLQEYFHNHPSVLRTSYKEHEMFSYDTNRAEYCRGINHTDFRAEAWQDFEDTHNSTEASAHNHGSMFKPKAHLRQKQRLRHIAEQFAHFKGQKGNYSTTTLPASAYAAIE